MKLFENLKYKQLRSLLEVVNEAKEKNVEFVKRRYESLSDNFNGAKDFLIKLKILNEINGKLTIKKTLQVAVNGIQEDLKLKYLLLMELMTANNKLTKEVFTYLDNFVAVKNVFQYKPVITARVKESPIRNFLMDLELIKYTSGTRTYTIKEDRFDIFKLYLQQKSLTPKELLFILKMNAKIGEMAENEVIEYEKERLAGHPEIFNNIKHTAKENVKAGYDILSWEKESKEGKLVERYIEVKAVSIYDFEFYWSRNEIETAEKLMEQYYLYLLPVIGTQEFDTENLLIIPNPLSNVFDSAGLWNKRIESYSFSKAIK